MFPFSFPICLTRNVVSQFTMHKAHGEWWNFTLSFLGQTFVYTSIPFGYLSEFFVLIDLITRLRNSLALVQCLSTCCCVFDYLFVCLFVSFFFFLFYSKNLSAPLGKSKDCLYRPVLQECTLKFNCSSQSLYETIRTRNRAQSLFHLHLHHPLFPLLYEIENAIYFIGQFTIECL